MLNETRTASILQRVPAILAVTAHSYGLNLQAADARKPQAAGAHRRNERSKAADGKPAAHQ